MLAPMKNFNFKLQNHSVQLDKIDFQFFEPVHNSTIACAYVEHLDGSPVFDLGCNVIHVQIRILQLGGIIQCGLKIQVRPKESNV